MQDGGLVQTRELGHVLDFVELGRVHLLDVILGHPNALAGVGDLDLDLVPDLALDAGGDEAMVAVGDPYEALLRPLRLRRRVLEGVPRDHQVLELGVVRVDLRHFES